VGTLGVGFLSVKILTNLMGATTYGQLMLGVSIAALISLFIYGPLGQAATRFYSVCRERGDLAGYVVAFRHIHIRLLPALLLPASATTVVLSFVVTGVWPSVVAAAILYSVVTGINHGLLSMFSGMRRRAVVAAHQSGESAARLFGAVLVMVIAGISPGAALFGYASGSLLVLGSLARIAGTARELDPVRAQRFQFAGPASGTIPKALYAEIWRYVAPFLVWAAIGYAFLHGDRWMLQGVGGTEAVGIYVAIYQIGSALPNAINSVMYQYLEPLVFERAEASGEIGYKVDGTALIRRAVLYIGLLVTAIVIAASVWSREIIDFVVGAEFARHSSLLAWVVAGTGITGLGQILTIQGLAMRRPSAYVGPKVAAACTLLWGAYIGAARRGAEGVAMALAAAGSVYLVSVLIANARLARHESP
jgi:O-antigen/teichoic acid export membrane protein